MERIKIKDGTTWPDPTGDDFKDLAWRLRYANESLEKSCFFDAAEIIEAYSTLIAHPAFTLKKVQEKVSGIRKAMKDNDAIRRNKRRNRT